MLNKNQKSKIKNQNYPWNEDRGPACRQAGQTLIEALISFGIAIVLVTAITVAVLASLVNARFSKNRSVATQYAQQAMEFVRQQRDSGNTLFSGTRCLDIDKPMVSGSFSIPIPQCDAKLDSPNSVALKRQIDIENNIPSCSNLRRATITVSWSDNKCTASNAFCNNVKLVWCFSDYTPVPGP